MRRFIAGIGAVVMAVVFISSALAVPTGRILEWRTGSSTVVFDGGVHSSQGLKCTDCHPKPFMMKKDFAKMKMVELINGQYCGECHNGKKAFPSNTAKDCGKCHKM